MEDHFYDEESLLALSGIQHFAFCERQWALIHVEKQWAENVRTVEGKQIHERVDDPYFLETRNNVKLVRSVPLVSKNLGLYGIADIVEYIFSPNSQQPSEINIIEYKRGKVKPDDRDEVQLCAQAMCLEEMTGVVLDKGWFYYAETRHRLKVEFTKDLRERVTSLAGRMHHLAEQGITPSPVKKKSCRNCSLIDLCLPKLEGKKAKKYIEEVVAEAAREVVGD